MPLEYGEIEIQEDLGTTPKSFKYDIDTNYTINNIAMSVFALKESVTAATIQNLVDKIESVSVSTKVADPESTIDGDDLFDLPKYLFANTHNFVSKLESADNIPHAFGMMYPFSPLPHNMRAPFGLAPNLGKQLTVKTNADVAADFDNYTMDVIAEGVSGADAGTQGHIKLVRDSYSSGAVNSSQDTQIIGKRLLGVYNFMNTSYDDLAAGASHDVTGIREQQLLKSSKSEIFWKPFYQWNRRKNAHLNDYAVTAGDESDNTDILEDGRWFHDLGIQSLPAGIDISNINEKYEIRTIAGVAADETRVYGVLLA